MKTDIEQEMIKIMRHYPIQIRHVFQDRIFQMAIRHQKILILLTRDSLIPFFVRNMMRTERKLENLLRKNRISRLKL